MIRSSLLLSLALLVPLHASALGRITATNGLAVAGDANRIEVFSRVALPGSAYFCAAGEFARKALRAGATNRVKVVVPLSPSVSRPGQTSVIFSLSEPGQQRLLGNPFLQVRRAGRSLSVGHANFLCNDTHDGGDD